jgi:hypothetical protein
MQCVCGTGVRAHVRTGSDRTRNRMVNVAMSRPNHGKNPRTRRPTVRYHVTGQVDAVLHHRVAQLPCDRARVLSRRLCARARSQAARACMLNVIVFTPAINTLGMRLYHIRDLVVSHINENLDNPSHHAHIQPTINFDSKPSRVASGRNMCHTGRRELHPLTGRTSSF